MGDFNAQIGSRRNGEELILGQHSYGVRTRNGEKLIDLAHEHHLTILNTKFKKRKSKRWTWTSPGDRYRNEIDYILSNRSERFSNCGVIQNLNFNSNHRMLRATLQKKNSRHSRPFKVKPNLTKLVTSNEELKGKLHNFRETTKELTTQQKFNKLEELLHSEKLNESTKKQTSERFSEKTIKLLQDRKDLISCHATSKTIRKEIAKLSKEIKINMRKDRQTLRMKTFEKHIARTGGVKKAIKELTDKKDWIPTLKNKAGMIKTKRPDIMSVATKFYKELYSKQYTEQPTVMFNTEAVPEILQSEVERALLSQNKDKAPGSDNITNEFLIQAKDTMIPILTYLFNNVIDTEYIPEQWTTSTIILLHKKGDKNDIGNYRPISLMSNIYKIFAKIILNRITRVLDENQPREQAGFRSGFSTIDHIHVVRQVFEKYTEYQLTFYCCFVDYCKAFDSLDHGKIWEALNNQGVDKKYTRLIQNVYKNSTARVKLEKEGDVIQIQRGVRQGDPLSPKLFSAVLEDIFREMAWEKLGLNINGENLTHLRFADDLIIFATNPEDLQTMLNDLDKASRKVGLSMSTQKTKIMSNGEQVPIVVNSNPIEYVTEYIYLGQLISTDELMTKEIATRIGKAWKRYWSLKDIMKNKEMAMPIKTRLFNTCILPVLTYGCQTWALTQTNLKKLEVCQVAMERSMLNKRKSDRIRNRTIRQKTKIEDITVKVKKLKWRWAGHTIRGKDKWSRAISEWYPRDGNRKRGRPFRRWADEIKKAVGNTNTWTRTAKDRKSWKELEEAFAKRQTDGETDEE